LGQLTALELLFLYDNQLTGTIPSATGQLLALAQLSIHSNQLTGVIPSEVGHLTALEQLYLYRNELTGTVPSNIGSLVSIEELWLQDNGFTGPLPAGLLADTRKLRSLFLQDNLLTGHVQHGTFNRSTQLDLATIDMSNNRLSGSILTEMFFLPQLKVLSLSGKALSMLCTCLCCIIINFNNCFLCNECFVFQ
jgi:Leucine-rich repeat (LRR) protein